jgi:hypothetical protein
MTPYLTARRSFLRAAGASLGLTSMLRSAEASAGGAGPPVRFMVIHRPTGTVRAQWLPQGTESSFTLAPIMKPFEPVRSHMVALDGLSLRRAGPIAGPHEMGMVTMMTGAPVGPSPQQFNCASTGPSIDQLFLSRSPALQGTPFPSLQLAADGRAQINISANRAASYSGPAAPLYPDVDPRRVYERIFGSFMPTGDPQKLARARARKKSVLDFVRGDLARLQRLAPASELSKLDAHTAAIRDLEKSIDATMTGVPASCGGHQPPPAVSINSSASHGVVGKLQLDLVRAAFACDLTRVVTFTWAGALSIIAFEGLYPGMPKLSHHPASHESGMDQAMGAIDQWYSVRTAEFISGLANTVEGSGSLLDNTLVVYTSEVSHGHSHSYSNMPILLFGGPGVRLRGNRFVTRRGTTNDLWLAAASVYGVDLPSLGAREQWTGPVPDVFP